MDARIPEDIATALEQDRRRRRRKASRFRVEAQDRRYDVIELGPTGFVIEAEEPPHLRGYIDILEGDERVARKLCVCVSAADGLVRYEYKRESAIGDVTPDHVKPPTAGLLGAPEG